MIINVNLLNGTKLLSVCLLLLYLSSSHLLISLPCWMFVSNRQIISHYRSLYFNSQTFTLNYHGLGNKRMTEPRLRTDWMRMKVKLKLPVTTDEQMGVTASNKTTLFSPTESVSHCLSVVVSSSSRWLSIRPPQEWTYSPPPAGASTLPEVISWHYVWVACANVRMCICAFLHVTPLQV